MTIDVRIHRLRGRYRVLDPDASAPGVQQRLDAIARRQLRDAVDLLLPGVLDELGIDPQAEVVIRQLRVRIRILDGERADADIGVAWARAIAQALHATLVPVAGGGESEDAVVLPSRFVAEQRWLAAVLAGRPEPWWVRALLGGGGPPPPPAAVLEGWVRTAPEAAPAALVELARAAPRGLGELLNAAQASALLECLAAAWAVDLADRPDPAGPVPPTAGDGAAAPPRADLAATDRAAADRAAAARAPGVQHRLLIALASALAGRSPRRQWSRAALLATVATDPVAAGLSPGLPVPPAAALPAEAAVAPASPPLPQPRRAAAEAPPAAGGPHADPEPAPAPAPPLHRPPLRPADADEPVEAPATARGLPVELGGLLFLVRPLARSPVVLEHDGDERQGLLHAIGWRALATVIGPLPQAARAAAWERHRGLLGVFVGLDRLPEDLSLPPAGPVWQAQADAALARLVQRLPASLPPQLDGWRLLYGAGRLPFDPATADGRLASLLLRPGRLRLTRTHADLDLPLRSVDTALRVGGWDIDPGWVPHLGRVIRFHYEDPWT